VLYNLSAIAEFVVESDLTLQVFVESGEMWTWTHLQDTDWHGTMLYFQRQSGHCFIFT